MSESLLSIWDGTDGESQSGARGGATLGARMISQVRGNAHLWSQVAIPKNASVYSCGKPDRALYVMESGLVKTTMVSRGGKECLLDIYVPGDVIGEASLLGRERIESAVAMSRATLMRIPVDNFVEVLDQEGLTEPRASVKSMTA